MDIKILDSHLREYLDTDAKPNEIAKYLSLCGPTFDRTKKIGKDWIYEIEVTTNRVDAACVMGIAKEATAILPQFGFKARIKKPAITKYVFPKNSLPLKIINEPKLERRLTGVVLENIDNWQSPKWMTERLETAGIRSINAVVDITNYVMITLGHPCHAFDYDKIEGALVRVRESKKGERITTLDGKSYTLPGGDIVFEDGAHNIIDLPGIMGLKNSVVSKETKKVLFFFDNNNPVKIRKTTMSTGIRTLAATLNEKSVDPELIPVAMSMGIKLFKDICKTNVASKIYDIYPNPYKEKLISTSIGFIEKILGVKLEKRKINSILKSLNFKPKWEKDILKVSVPSYRANDINIEEDLVEEIARIYGYHNLPGKLMDGELPQPLTDTPFKFEESIRLSLKMLGGIETLTYSLIPENWVNGKHLKLKNPLGVDTQSLRISLKQSLLDALRQNSGIKNPYHLFEIANVYIPQKNNLPKEQMMLSGVFANYEFRKAKGVLEALFESLNIDHEINLELINNALYYEFEIESLRQSLKTKKYNPISKYPSHFEDLTINVPDGKYVGEVIQSIKHASSLVRSVELIDIFERNFTFRIEYHSSKKTLSDKEVDKERKKIKKIINN